MRAARVATLVMLLTLGAPGAARAGPAVRIQATPAVVSGSSPAGAAGRLDGRELRLLRGRQRRGFDRAQLVRRQERSRARGLERLAPLVAGATERLRPIALAVRRAGGRLVDVDPFSTALVAHVPTGALPGLRGRPDVRGIERWAVPRPMTLANQSAAAGAPTWWAAGNFGGAGPADTSPADLFIDEAIQEDQPLFAGLNFLRFPGNAASDCESGVTCGHGTAVASVVVARGAAGCSVCQPSDVDEKGIAYQPDKVIHLGEGGRTNSASSGAWLLGISQPDLMTEQIVPGVADVPEVANTSSGADAAEDYRPDLTLDLFVSQYGLPWSAPAGNAPTRLTTTCLQYNVICAGASTRGDRFVAPFSARGPSPAGRKKPDLVALGASNVGTGPDNAGNLTVADHLWKRDQRNRLTRGENGTSFSAPAVAGGMLLLAGIGISEPAVQKAILINSARPGRLTPAQAMGTQTTWQPDWGWGELDLDAAYRQRTNFYAQSVEAGGVRFYESRPAAADRTTLVWNKRATGCVLPGCAPQPAALTNLDLYALNPATGETRASSVSDKDNVEQIRAPVADLTIYKVKATGPIDGAASERFAIASAQQIRPLVNPKLEVQMTTSRQAVRPGQVVSVRAVVRNPSPDLTAEGASVQLDLPAGVTSATPTTAPLGTLAPGQVVELAWELSAVSDTAGAIAVTARTSRYGEAFTTFLDRPLLVDGTAPRARIARPAASQQETAIPLTWSASDGGAGVADFDVGVSEDGAAWTNLLAASTQTAATYTGRAAHGYRFRVRARDALGNTSEWATSPEVKVLEAVPGAPPGFFRRGIGMHSLRAAVRRGRMVLRGHVRSSVSLKPFRIVATGRRGKRTVRFALGVKGRNGRFVASRKVPRALRRTRVFKLQIRYLGTRKLAPLKYPVTVRR